MKRQLTSSLLVVLLLFVVALALGCRDRRERTQPQRASQESSSCTKATKAPDGWPMYVKRGGEGGVREKVAGLTRIDNLRTIDGWTLIRLSGTRRTGWVEESVVATCPAKGVKMAPREAPGGDDAEERPAEAPEKAPAAAPAQAEEPVEESDEDDSDDEE
jgi:hypothetical protein